LIDSSVVHNDIDALIWRESKQLLSQIGMRFHMANNKRQSQVLTTLCFLRMKETAAATLSSLVTSIDSSWESSTSLSILTPLRAAP
jgi:hypothetical protein